ncbi:glycosyltransferase [Candidatus Woesearchaeota archaeon]|nr:glycosyltransferase [Candidatus Woesearchaeota archaeon]
MKIKISACLVIYNEEKVIRRCLESLKGIVDEIIITLDGTPTDSTLSICKEYTSLIYIRPHGGDAERHRMFSYQKAANHWILEIDADEYLSKQLQQWLKSFKAKKNIAGYKFIWRQYYGNIPYTSKYFTNMYGKVALFDKNRILDENRELHAQLSLDGTVKKIPYIIEHKPAYNAYNLSDMEKLKRRAKTRAENLIKNNKANLPSVFYIPKAFLSFSYEFFKFISKGVLLDGYKGLMFALQISAVFFMINIYIFKLKSKR